MHRPRGPYGPALPDWPADAPATQLGRDFQNFRELVGEFFVDAKEARGDATLSELGKRELVAEHAQSFKEAQLEAARERVAAARLELKIRGERLDEKYKPVDEARAREIRAAWREHVVARGATLANLDLEQAITAGDDNELLAAIVYAPKIVRQSLASDTNADAARRSLWASDDSQSTAARVAEYDAVGAGVEIFDQAIEVADQFADEVKGASQSAFDEIVADSDRSLVAKQTVAEFLERRNGSSADAPSNDPTSDDVGAAVAAYLSIRKA
ncbi:MAG TPA: hypothetical protein VH539_15520 [Gemmatimonadaceae bacterium]|jgi:hypothetical protein